MNLRHLSDVELSWARAALETIFPGTSGDGGRLGARALSAVGAMDVELFFRDAFARIPLQPALGLRIAIWMVALAPLFCIGRWTTIDRLARVDRERVVGRLGTSSSYAVRQLTLALKAIGAMFYVAAPSVRAVIFPEVPRAAASGPRLVDAGRLARRGEREEAGDDRRDVA